MELKKNPEADLQNKKSLFFQIGLVASLAITLLAFEWTVYENHISQLGDLQIEIEEEEMIPIVPLELKPPPPPPPKPTMIEIVDDDEEIEEEVEMESEVDEDTEVQVETPVQEEEAAEVEIFTIVEEMPSFPGGEAKLFEYLGKNTKFPQMARDAGIQGQVYVNFVVYEDGSIRDVKVLRGIGGGCDEEAIRVVQNMPKWSSGKQRGKAVRVSYNLPIRFTLR